VSCVIKRFKFWFTNPTN